MHQSIFDKKHISIQDLNSEGCTIPIEMVIEKYKPQGVVVLNVFGIDPHICDDTMEILNTLRRWGYRDFIWNCRTRPLGLNTEDEHDFHNMHFRAGSVIVHYKHSTKYKRGLHNINLQADYQIEMGHMTLRDDYLDKNEFEYNNVIANCRESIYFDASRNKYLMSGCSFVSDRIYILTFTKDDIYMCVQKLLGKEVRKEDIESPNLPLSNLHAKHIIIHPVPYITMEHRHAEVYEIREIGNGKVRVGLWDENTFNFDMMSRNYHMIQE